MLNQMQALIGGLVGIAILVIVVLIVVDVARERSARELFLAR
jgi:hypothetical protein